MSEVVERKYSLGICIPVWNRGEVFAVAFEALRKQLAGIDASVWLFDNGSDPDTVRIVQSIQGSDNLSIVKTFFPENRGIPYVANLFSKAIQEKGDFAGVKPPDYALIMDADAYFQRPISHLLEILETDYSVGLVSGHDSIEHPSLKEMHLTIQGQPILVKEKDNERMISMLMRTEEFLLNYPFAHYRNRDVDWEITQWGSNALKKRFRRLFVACDYVLHLGINSSTWNEETSLLATREELDAVNSILTKAGLNSSNKHIEKEETNTDSAAEVSRPSRSITAIYPQ